MMRGLVLVTCLGVTWGSPLVTPKAQPLPAVFLESGTDIRVRLNEPVDSDQSYVTRTYRATVVDPVMGDGGVLLPAGGDCTLTVTHLDEGGRWKGRTRMALQLTSVVFNDRSWDVVTDPFTQDTAARGKQTSRNAGIGAAVGAVLGGVVAGASGAVIGATGGSAVGAGITGMTGKLKILIPVETTLVFTLENSVVLGKR